LPEQLPPQDLDSAKMEAGVRLLLDGLGQHDKAEVMENTPRRVADMYVEMVNPAWVDPETAFKTFANPGMDDLVLVNDVHYVSMCEHHLAPAFGVAHFAYAPDERVVGYSKIKKGLNYVARGPQLNERILTTTLDIVVNQVRPLWCGLILQSVHCCIAVRSNGPAQELVTVQGFRSFEPGPEPPEGDPDQAIKAAHVERMAATWRAELVQTSLARKPLFLGG
jgi:GTP cyclohydrolase I